MSPADTERQQVVNESPMPGMRLQHDKTIQERAVVGFSIFNCSQDPN